MSDDAPRATYSLLTIAALVVVLAGMRAASAIVVPLLVAVFIAIVVAAPVRWLTARHVPAWAANVLAVTGLVLVMLGLGLFVSQSVAEFTDRLPAYQVRLADLAVELGAIADRYGIDAAEELVLQQLDPGTALQLAGVVLRSFGNAVVYGVLVLLIVAFILSESAGLPRKLSAVLAQPERDLQHFFRFVETVNRYMAIKTLISAATGVAAGLLTAFIGVDFPLLWGLLAFLLNYIPNIGSIIAGTPPVLLALLQLGPGPALGVVGGYLAINIVMGNFVEPRYMGRGLGLSPLVVLLSVVFWGWLLGPVGALLSVPLTMTAKIGFEASPRTRDLAVLLGPTPAIEPDDEPSASADHPTDHPADQRAP